MFLGVVVGKEMLVAEDLEEERARKCGKARKSFVER